MPGSKSGMRSSQAPLKRISNIISTPSSRNHLSSNMSGTAALSTFIRKSSGWKNWRAVKITLSEVPLSISASHICAQLRRYGVASVISVKQTQQTRRQPPVQIVALLFSQLPKYAFWAAGYIELKLDPPLTGVYDVKIQADEAVGVVPEVIKPPPRRTVSVAAPPPMPTRLIHSSADSSISYPSIIQIQPLALTFGIMTSERFMMEMCTLKSDSVDVDCRQEIDIDFERRQIRVMFAVRNINPGNALDPQSLKAIIDFDNLTALYYVSPTETKNAYLRLSMSFPPLYFSFMPDDSNQSVPTSPTSHRGDSFRERDQRRDRDNWKRIVSVNGRLQSDTAPLSYHFYSRTRGFIDLGKWKTMRFELKCIPNIAQTIHALRDVNLPLMPEPYELAIQPRFLNPIWEYLDAPSERLLHSFPQDFTRLMENCHLPWPVRYQLEVCLGKGVFEEHAVTQEFINALAHKSSDDARFLLEQAADYFDRTCHRKSVPLFADAMEILEPGNLNFGGKRLFTGARIPHYCSLVRKAIITPTTIYFQTPAVESTNRVLRHFRDYQDRFLRVQFSDELLNGRISSGNNGNQNNEVYLRIFHVLDHGIRVGDRVFKFLACGNSQMREGGAHFFAETPDLTVNKIRNWMGDFSTIKNVARRAARLGQCFSTTRAIRGITVPTIKRIPDIQHNGFCFTDGVGKISYFLASLVMEEMEIFTIPGDPIPAAYQYRMGGCKGILVVSDDPSLCEVHIRKSQEKFQSQFNGLEIVRVSQFSVATLNRQTIVVLSSLGIPDSAFMKLLEDQLRDFEKAMTDPAVAITLLTRYIDENAVTLQIADMVKAGFLKPDNEEPFVMSVMNLWRTWSLKLLKEKARIVVPQGAFLLGCVDEKGLLRGHSSATEGSMEKDVNKLPQIFVRISDPDRPGQYMSIKSVCIVGRNPSLHPGDIRVVQAVDVPELHRLTNVVVFPSTGDRDVPSMLSGGDLDGDDFFVIWDKSLIPPIWNHSPMPVTPVPSLELNREITNRHLSIFFVKYLRGDTLPIIAHAHLAWADARGADSPQCLELAQLHSKAVDFIKTGDPAVMPSHLNPKKWPHYMEKRHGSQYHSKGALGAIYDCVQKVEFSPFYTKPMYRSILALKVSDDLLKLASSIKSDYDMEMRRLMSQFEIDTEFEMWTTFVLSKPRVGTGYKMQERIGKEISVLKRNFRELCVDKCGGIATFDSVRNLLIAMYYVTAAECEKALKDLEAYGWSPTPQNMPLISFPWIFSEWMCKLTDENDKAEDAVPLSKVQADKLHINTRNRKPQNAIAPTGDVVIDDGRIIKPGENLDLFGDYDACKAIQVKPLIPAISASAGSPSSSQWSWDPPTAKCSFIQPSGLVPGSHVKVISKETVDLEQSINRTFATESSGKTFSLSPEVEPNFVHSQLTTLTADSFSSGEPQSSSPDRLQSLSSPQIELTGSPPVDASVSPPLALELIIESNLPPPTAVGKHVYSLESRVARDSSRSSEFSKATSFSCVSTQRLHMPSSADETQSLCEGMEMLDIYDASPKQNRRSPSAPVTVSGRSASQDSDYLFHYSSEADSLQLRSVESSTAFKSDSETFIEIMTSRPLVIPGGREVTVPESSPERTRMTDPEQSMADTDKIQQETALESTGENQEGKPAEHVDTAQSGQSALARLEAMYGFFE